MSLIFGNFPSVEKAQEFAVDVQKIFGHEALVFTTYEEAHEHDFFPFEFPLPVVHVERCDDLEIEEAIGRFVQLYDGKFIGT